MGTNPLTPRLLYSSGDASDARQLKQANRPHYQGLACSLLFLLVTLAIGATLSFLPVRRGTPRGLGVEGAEHDSLHQLRVSHIMSQFAGCAAKPNPNPTI